MSRLSCTCIYFSFLTPIEGLCCIPKYWANIIHHFSFVFTLPTVIKGELPYKSDGESPRVPCLVGILIKVNYRLRAVPQDGERLANEKTLVNRGETGLVYMCPLRPLA